jgi:hypothetical protein
MNTNTPEPAGPSPVCAPSPPWWWWLQCLVTPLSTQFSSIARSLGQRTRLGGGVGAIYVYTDPTLSVICEERRERAIWHYHTSVQMAGVGTIYTAHTTTYEVCDEYATHATRWATYVRALYWQSTLVGHTAYAPPPPPPEEPPLQAGGFVK